MLKRLVGAALHCGVVCKLCPERAKDAYRRARDRTMRAHYDPSSFWTRWGKTYIRDFPPGGERNEQLFVDLVRGLGAQSVLDVGCGYGRYLLALRERAGVPDLCGVDISPTQIDQARRHLQAHPDVRLLAATATSLPLPDASCDFVITYGLMIHLRPDEVPVFLREARRVARRGGLFLESCFNPGQPHLNPPYYFAHDYPALFAQERIAVERRMPVHPENGEYLYVATWHPAPARQRTKPDGGRR